MCILMRAIMEKIKRRGENYTIPQIDLSVEPKNTKEEFKYLYENVTVEKKGGYLGHPDSVRKHMYLSGCAIIGTSPMDKTRSAYMTAYFGSKGRSVYSHSK